MEIPTCASSLMVIKNVRCPFTVPSDSPGPPCENVFSETSAFTRIATVTPRKNLNSVKFKPGEDEQSSVAELFADLGGTVSELISTVKLLQQQTDARLEELHNTM